MSHRAALQRVVDAWETLAGGRNYPAREIEDWLHFNMKPAIDEARVALQHGPRTHKRVDSVGGVLTGEAKRR